MKEKDHKHEEGESKEKCANCIAGRLIGEFTEYEIFCFSWFRINVTQFTFDAHLVGKLLDELKLKELTKRLFLKALNMIYQNDMKISQAKARQEARKKA